MASPVARTLYIKTYGCQMNVYDSERIADVMRPLGYRLTADYHNADMVLLNTCHIRERAAEKVYSELGRLNEEKQRLNIQGKSMTIAVAGCVGQAEGEEIFKRAPYVDIVVGPQSYQSLPDLVSKIHRERGHAIDISFSEDKFDQLPENLTVPLQGAASVSIQEGCDKFCTFCVVPYTRGAEYSRPVADIYRECLRLAAHGAIEITLLGQNVNAFHGLDPDGQTWNLGMLIAHIGTIDGIKRIRYSTSHPRDMHEDLYLAHRDQIKLMPFLNLPVQSGSNRVLRAMNRKHTRETYFQIIERLRKECPAIQFSSDFIIGFPGETQSDFDDTMDLARQVGFVQAYSFVYSPRPGTPGAEMDHQVDDETKAKRLQDFQALIHRQQLAFNQSCEGKIMEIIPDRPGKRDGQMIGRSPYMQSVYVQDIPPEYAGKLVPVKIIHGYANSLEAELL